MATPLNKNQFVPVGLELMAAAAAAALVANTIVELQRREF